MKFRKPRKVYFDGERALITLGKARGVLVVDTEKAHAVVGRRWFLHEEGYAIDNARTRVQKLLMPEAKVVDHINGDKLDNRLGNLRAATRQENSRNQRKLRGKYRFKGIAECYNGFRAYITRDRKRYHLGVFRTQEEAARAYDKAALELHGEFAATNESLGLL